MSSKSQLDAYISIRFIVGILEFNVTRVLSFSKPSFDTCLFDSIVCLADISKKKKSYNTVLIYRFTISIDASTPRPISVGPEIKNELQA